MSLFLQIGFQNIVKILQKTDYYIFKINLIIIKNLSFIKMIYMIIYLIIYNSYKF